MRYFQRLNENIPVTAPLNAIMRHPELWNQDNIRTTVPGTPHTDVSDILLRWGQNDLDSLLCFDRPTMAELFGFKQIALGIMASLYGSMLGKVIVTKLPPGGRIAPHHDGGGYARFYTRTHLVLQSLPGNLFICGDETVQMRTGELWWFDTQQEHQCINNSNDDRIHLIVDLRVDD